MNFLDSLQFTGDLATLPSVATRILTILENDHVRVKELSEAIEMDVSISAKVLQAANSPMFALRNSVTSISEAITTIGMNRVSNIVLGVSIFSKFMYLSNTTAGPFINKFLVHSSATAGVAKSLSRKLGTTFQDKEFIGGLIHDVGKLSMIQYSDDLYQKVIDLTYHEGVKDVEAEAFYYGATHGEAGEVLSKAWKLPVELTNIIAFHDSQQPSGDDSGVVSLVRLADIVCEKSGAGIGEASLESPVSTTTSWRNLCARFPELRAKNVDKICTEFDDDVLNSTSFLSVLTD